MAKFRIYYFSKDQAFLEGLEKTFASEFPDHEIEIDQTDSGSDFDFQNEFLKIFNNDYNIVYVDFSLNADACLQLTRILCREVKTRNMAIIGLHEFLSNRSKILQSIQSGVTLNYIKGSDFFDPAAHAIYRVDSSLLPKTKFAENVDQFETNGAIHIGLCYATSGHFHTETNIKFEEGQTVEIRHHVLDRIMGCRNFIVKEISKLGLYYNFKYGLNFQFTYLDSERYVKDFVEMHGTGGNVSQEDVQRAYETECGVIYQKINNWVDNEANRVSPKKIKVLVVDQSYSILQNKDGEKALDLRGHPFTLYFQSTLDGNEHIVRRILPQVIAFVWDLDHDEEVEKDSIQINRRVALKKLIEDIRELKAIDYEPTLIIFNGNAELDNLKTELAYHKLLINKSSISMTVILGLANMFHQRLEDNIEKYLEKELAIRSIQPVDTRKMGIYPIRDLVEDRVFYKSEDTDSAMEFLFNLKVLKMSETEMYFTTTFGLTNGCVFKIQEPVELYATVVPMPERSQYDNTRNCFRAFINGIDIEVKQNLRQKICSNTVIQEDEEDNKDIEDIEENEENEESNTEQG